MLMLMAVVVPACIPGASPTPVPEVPTSTPTGTAAVVSSHATTGPALEDMSPTHGASGPSPVPSLVGSSTSSVAMPSPPPAIETIGQTLVSASVSVLADRALEALVKLTEEFSPRESGTEQEKAAADFLVEQYEAMGYAVELQRFPAVVLCRNVPVLSLNAPNERVFRGIPFVLSGEGQATGVMVDVGQALPDDLPSEGLDGKIALIQRGTITFGEKVSTVTHAGAVAVVVYNNEAGLFGGRLLNRASVPAVSISQESGEAIKELMASSEVEATISVIFETRNSRNVVAEKPGAKDDGGVIVLGGHFDTVPQIPGANDNGSGIATLLTVAREVSGRSYPFTLRFVSFGSEELGLLGSRFYVGSLASDELGAVIAMLNFDALGSGEVVELEGTFGLLSGVLEYGRANGIEVKLGIPLEGTSSDHAAFEGAGVPVVFFTAGDLSRLHLPNDTIEFVRPELMGAVAALALGFLDALAEP